MADNGQIQVKDDASMIVLSFAEAPEPLFTPKSNVKWIPYGVKDTYPKYLLDCFNKSSKHNAIIKGKVTYIVGNGWKVDGEDYDFPVNGNGESLNCLAEKCSLDTEVFGGFYLHVIRKKNGEHEFYHLNYHKVRSDKDNKKFFFREDGDFTKRGVEPKEYEAYNPTQNQPEAVFYYKEYRPGVDTYTLPGYVAAMNFIEADIEVSKHTLGNAKTGFTASKLITLPNGEPTPEAKRTIEQKFRTKFSGSDGQKFMISFVGSVDKKPIVEDLGTSDMTKENFTAIDNLIQSNIFVGHRVVSPMLFGVKTEGQLGGREELRVAYEIFQKTYIKGRQHQLEEIFRTLLEEERLTIQRTEPISFVFGETTMAANMTTDEIRNSMGLPSLDKDEISAEMSDTLEKLRIVSPLIANRLVATMTDNEIRAMIGLPELQPTPTGEETIPPEIKPPVNKPKFADISRLENIGHLKSDYFLVKEIGRFSSADEAADAEAEYFRMQFADVATLTATEEMILELIRKNPNITNDIIASTLHVKPDAIEKAAASLEKKGFIESKSVKSGLGDEKSEVRTVPTNIPSIASRKEISVKYTYEHRPDVDWKSGVKNSRAFCKKIEELDRVYSRKDINQLSTAMGYDVWVHCGGWYHNPETGKNESQCRHQWVGHVVIKKVNQ
jgi:hypothetical protein